MKALSGSENTELSKIRKQFSKIIKDQSLFQNKQVEMMVALYENKFPL
jgi:hypothetical protein